VDVCASSENAKCERFYTKDQDGLRQDWSNEVVWCNPPFQRQIGQWIRKAYEASQAGATAVCLVPARTDSPWFHEYALRGEIRFIRGRLKFGGAEKGAPFPSMIIVFRRRAIGSIWSRSPLQQLRQSVNASASALPLTVE
jgi:phage N-6-adenine-methyltransferase